MVKNQKKLMKKIIAIMAIVAFGAGFVNISEAAISRIPSISSRSHGMVQERNRDRVHRNDKNNNNRNENHANAPKEESVKNTNVNDEQPQEATVTNKKENNNRKIGSRRNDVGSRKRETPAKIVRDIDRSHDATYDEDDRYKAQRESYFEDDGNGRIVDEQREIVEERRQIGSTESDRERGRETIINRYDNESDRRGNRGNRDEGGVTVVINNNIPIENNIEVNVEAVNKNENNNDIKQESNTEVTNTNNNDNDNINKTETHIRGVSSEEIPSDTRPIPVPEIKPSPKWQKGDVNHDGKVDAEDKQIIVDYQIDLRDTINFEEADMNSDGKINIYDTIAIAFLLKDMSSDKASENTPKILWGDVNSNGRIDERDAQLIADYIVNAISDNDLDLSVADVTNDGQVDVSDTVAIKNYLAGSKYYGRTGTEKKKDDIASLISVVDIPMANAELK